jgi:hypothetical protein
MAKNTTPYFWKQTRRTSFSFVNATGTTAQTICTAGADDSGVYEILCTSDDTVARDMTFYINDGATDSEILLATVSIQQGTVITNPQPLRLINNIINFIAGRELDVNQNYFVPLQAGWSIKAKVNVAVSATRTIKCRAIIKDY